MKGITAFIIRDIFRSRIVITYTLLLAGISWAAFLLESNPAKGVLTLLNIVLLIVPLFSILFSTIYIYNSSEFIELLLSQPVTRKRIWLSLYSGAAFSLVTAVLISTGMPLLLFAETGTACIMIIMAVLLTLVFTSLAFLAAVLSRDKAKGIGIAIITWLFLVLFSDVIILFLLIQFSGYPVERLAVILTSANPVDLARILILMKLDISAMMGHTGAIFKSFFGNAGGLLLSLLLLVVWTVMPGLLSLRKFNKKDL